jgi:polyhydroxyalkanoate synthesis repressor PhaR
MQQRKSVVIKKYENRRLYDTTNSRYVNLEEVAQLLKQGNDVQVIDASSNEDITRLIFAQIIVEDAKLPNSTFPLDLLRQMVIASGRATQESTLKYMEAMLDLYQNTYRAMAPPLNPFDFMQNLRVDRDISREDKPAGSAPQTGQEQANRPDPDEVRELKKRLIELEALVAKLVPGKP